MIQNREIEYKPVRVLFDYFERALQDIGLGVWLSLLRPGYEEYFREKIRDRVYSELSSQPRKHKHEVEEVLREPDAHMRWEPWEDPEEEIWSHYRLQSLIVATLLGDRDALMSLAAQLITEPMNRKLVISYFLGNLTDGIVGLTYKELPSKAQVLQWVQEIGQIQLTDRLSEIARQKYE